MWNIAFLLSIIQSSILTWQIFQISLHFRKGSVIVDYTVKVSQPKDSSATDIASYIQQSLVNDAKTNNDSFAAKNGLDIDGVEVCKYIGYIVWYIT